MRWGGVAQVVEFGLAVVLLVLLADRSGGYGFVVGIGLLALGWLLHDDEPRPAERDSSP